MFFFKFRNSPQVCVSVRMRNIGKQIIAYYIFLNRFNSNLLFGIVLMAHFFFLLLNLFQPFQHVRWIWY